MGMENNQAAHEGYRSEHQRRPGWRRQQMDRCHAVRQDLLKTILYSWGSDSPFFFARNSAWAEQEPASTQSASAAATTTATTTAATTAAAAATTAAGTSRTAASAGAVSSA